MELGSPVLQDFSSVSQATTNQHQSNSTYQLRPGAHQQLCSLHTAPLGSKHQWHSAHVVLLANRFCDLWAMIYTTYQQEMLFAYLIIIQYLD